jgi:Flp pilus assembly protein TadB
MAARDRASRVTDVPPSLSESQRRRQRAYLLMMGVCLTLIVLAWTLVRLWSTPLAVAMSFVAALIPPIAAFVANRGDGG